MPFNGAGVYNPIGVPDFPAIPDTTIRASQYNNEINDIAAALTNCVTRNGQSPATADLPMGTWRHSNVGAPVLRTHYGRVAELQDGAPWKLTSVAGTDVITGTLPYGFAAYSVDQVVYFRAAGTNTDGGVTLNINAIGPVGIKYPDGTDLLAGEFVAGTPVSVLYNGTNFILLSRNPTLAAASVADVVAQTWLKATTAGTSTAYTLTPAKPITAYTAGQSFWVTFHTASGAAPTLAISGVAAPPNLVKQIADGTYANIAANDLPTNHRSRVTLLSASQALVEDMPPAAIVPTGTIHFFAFNTLYTGYLKCNGAAYSRTTYAALYAALNKTATVTITIATPGVVTWNSHGLSANDPVKFTTTGALPTGLTAGTTYYVVGASITANTFQVSATAGGPAIATSGAQSGVHTGINSPWGDGDGSTTFNVPDLRGEFLRGWDDGRTVDSNRAFGSAQSDLFKSHTHTIVGLTGSGSYQTSNTNGATVTWSQGATEATGGVETRPRNIAGLWCIKY